jgi:hypothetical protein
MICDVGLLYMWKVIVYVYDVVSVCLFWRLPSRGGRQNRQKIKKFLCSSGTPRNVSLVMFFSATWLRNISYVPRLWCPHGLMSLEICSLVMFLGNKHMFLDFCRGTFVNFFAVSTCHILSAIVIFWRTLSLVEDLSLSHASGNNYITVWAPILSETQLIIRRLTGRPSEWTKSLKICFVHVP